MMTSHDVLKKYFGFDSFREHQKEVIDTLVSGKDAFVLMPTGSGKSLCFQIPAILREGVGIVVSPLIALMEDQVVGLRQNGIKADYLNSSLPYHEVHEVAERLKKGETDLLFVAPERLLTEKFQDFISTLPIALFAIDEAHCVSQWGHNFRPEYLKITDVTRKFKGVPRIALTATADKVTRKEILEKLELNGATRFLSSFDRPNICYTMMFKEKGKKQVLGIIGDGHREHTGIIYCRSRKRVDDLTRFLCENGMNAVNYHAGLSTRERTTAQKRFAIEPSIVVVATIAFGMGIDRPDVRFVIHFDVPLSMEAYYQETGRSGRDGEPADAILLYSLSDVIAVRQMLQGSEGEENFKMVQQQKLNAFLGYCETIECRRQVLLRYFGEHLEKPCNNCSTCMEETQSFDGTIVAQKALSAVYRTGQRFGAQYIINVLRGVDNDRIKGFGHDRIKTFGVGEDMTERDWRSIFRQLMTAGYLFVDMGMKAGFKLTEKSWPILKGEETLRFRKDIKAKKSVGHRAVNKESVPDHLDGPSENLFQELRKVRFTLAQEASIPAYLVFHDKTLKDMARKRPKDRDELLSIHGVGSQKAETYGEQFLKAIHGWVSEGDAS